MMRVDARHHCIYNASAECGVCRHNQQARPSQDSACALQVGSVQAVLYCWAALRPQANEEAEKKALRRLGLALLSAWAFLPNLT